MEKIVLRKKLRSWKIYEVRSSSLILEGIQLSSIKRSNDLQFAFLKRQ